MSRALKAVEVAPPAPVVDPLAGARERVADLKRQLVEVEASASRAENATSPVEQTATQAQGVRQRLKSNFAGMLQAGSLNTSTPEVADITKQLASAEDAERQSAAIADAHRSVVADYQSRIADLRGQLATATRTLDELLFAAAGADIRERLIPAYLHAADQLAVAKAALEGAGQGHCQLAAPLRERGTSAQGLGTDKPEKVMTLHPIGFGISTDGAVNTLRRDCSASIANACAEFSSKWSR